MSLEIGDRYRHFKGGEYEIIAVGSNSDKPEQEVVVYKALYGDGKVWVRLLDEFIGYKEIDGEKIKRFELIR